MGIWLRGTWTAEGDNDAGVLLLHGFSGDPQEMLPLAHSLADAGYSVRVPVLPGHGGVPQELLGIGWREWLHAAQNELVTLRTHCRRVAVAGLSMGGALATLLAADGLVDALVLLATPTHLSDDWRLNVLPLAKYVMPWFKPLAQADFNNPVVREQILAFDPTADLDDPAVQTAIRDGVRLPVAAIDQLVRLLRTARSALPQVTTPALVLHGIHDDTAPPQSATEIARKLGGSTELVWWEHSGHLLLAGPEAAAIVHRVVAFCDAILQTDAATHGAPYTI